jgi:hypothetical protein
MTVILASLPSKWEGWGGEGSFLMIARRGFRLLLNLLGSGRVLRAGAPPGQTSLSRRTGCFPGVRPARELRVGFPQRRLGFAALPLAYPDIPPASSVDRKRLPMRQRLEALAPVLPAGPILRSLTSRIEWVKDGCELRRLLDLGPAENPRRQRSRVRRVPFWDCCSVFVTEPERLLTCARSCNIVAKNAPPAWFVKHT